MEPTQSNNFENNLEAEIAELSKEIEVKRRILAEQKGVVEEGSEKELVRDALRERIMAATTTSATSDDDKSDDQVIAARPTTSTAPSRDYLENLDQATIIQVNELIGELAHHSLDTVIRKAVKAPAHILDAFHDTLVNRLYDDLKKRGLID